MAKYTNRKIITKPRILHRAHVKKDLEKMPGDSKKAMDYCHLTIIPDMAKAREAADQLETLTDSKYWPFPVYSDLLFSV